MMVFFLNAKGIILTVMVKGVAAQSLGSHSLVMRLHIGVVERRHIEEWQENSKKRCNDCLVLIIKEID